MSKLHDAYLSMKKKDKNTIILFKSGMFYVSLENDARLVSSILDLKLTRVKFRNCKMQFSNKFFR